MKTLGCLEPVGSLFFCGVGLACQDLSNSISWLRDLKVFFGRDPG